MGRHILARTFITHFDLIKNEENDIPIVQCIL